MVFSSMEFLFRFLPLFLLIYFVTKPKYRNVVLLLGSLVFYAYGEPIYAERRRRWQEEPAGQ